MTPPPATAATAPVATAVATAVPATAAPSAAPTTAASPTTAAAPAALADAEAPGSVAEILSAIFLRPARGPAGAGGRRSTDQDAFRTVRPEPVARPARSARSSDVRHPVTGS